MRAGDIAGMCLQNLKRRRARTILTSLGVLVGTCSIVVMVSIGFGLSEQTNQTLSQMGDLTIVQVTPPYSYSSSGSSDSGNTVKLDDAAVGEIQAVEHVSAVSPKVSLQADGYTFALYAGVGDRYQSNWSTIVGMDGSALESVGYEVTEGTGLSSSTGTSKAAIGGTVDVLVGQSFAYNFADTYRSEDSQYVDRYSYLNNWDGTGDMPDDSAAPDPWFDPLSVGNMSLAVLDGDGKEVARFSLHPVGVLKEDYNKGEETGSGVVMNVSDVRAILAQVTGKTPSVTYSQATVKVDDISNVASAENSIKAMGFSTSSMESIRKPMEQQAAQQQLMLGGLGAISLFVAAIGITNTMVMSITERTREIGVMKALGCYVRDIRALFLAEAGSIGLLGGLAGCVVSFCISMGMNLVNSGDFSAAGWHQALFGSDTAARMSVIPWWLYIFAVVFSVLVGLLSGYYPARKATKISAIEAIRQ